MPTFEIIIWDKLFITQNIVAGEEEITLKHEPKLEETIETNLGKTRLFRIIPKEKNASKEGVAALYVEIIRPKKIPQVDLLKEIADAVKILLSDEFNDEDLRDVITAWMECFYTFPEEEYSSDKLVKIAKSVL